MTSLANHKSSKITKLLLMGESKAGKTGSLTSLVKAGYKLRILDYDNLLDTLALLVAKECPDKSDNVEYRVLRDKFKSGPAGTPIIEGGATAFVNGLKMLDNWKYGDVDLGKPAGWGEDTIVVIDSLTRMSDAAFDYAMAMSPGAKEPRQWYFTAQQHIENMIRQLTSESFNTNVIVIAHIRYQERADKTIKGFPNSIGSALGPIIPTYFPSVALAQTTGAGTSVKRTLQTTSTGMIDLANPAPFKMVPTLPLETGLATFFETVRS